MNLESPVIILVETMGPANLGSVARAAAAYNRKGFRLVSPRCQVDEDTKKWACYGKRVLPNIEIFEDLDSALSDIDLAVALSRREGKNRHRHYSLPKLCSDVIPELCPQGRVGLVFGNEESGLARHHLAACHCSVEIPVLADDGSLNLAHAVTVALYESLGRSIESESSDLPKNKHEELAPAERLRDLLNRCEETLEGVGYPRHRSSLKEELVKLQTIIARSRLENWEVRLLLGMVKQVQYKLDNPNSKKT